MSVTRRQMLLAGLGLLMGGCAGAPSTSRRPGAPWPGAITSPRTMSGIAVDRQATAVGGAARGGGAVGGAAAMVPGLIERARWTSASPVPRRVNPMGGIDRLTIHHEGSSPITFSDTGSTAARIESVRRAHVDQRGWGDIGYHFIIDRAGRCWEGRPLGYQGAHVSQNNEHNIGLMLLGNFDRQSPSDAQLTSLVRVVNLLAGHHRLPQSRIYTHQELMPTACPGRILQPRVASLRSNGRFA